MPPHQTNLTSETRRDAAGLGLDRSIASANDAMDDAVAAARRDATIAALDDAVSEKDAVGPPAAPARSVLGLLARYWRAFQESRQRQRLRVTLHDLSDRELMDIGLTRGEIDYIAAHRVVEKLRDGAAHPWLSRGVM
ncbi:MAG: DUF1127 domain-containing protein [Bradyrhizobium sp.]